jgi:hypothetical protein
MQRDIQPFTPLFQREMLILLLKDPTAYGRYQSVWNPSCFDDVSHRTRPRSSMRESEPKSTPPRPPSSKKYWGGRDLRGPLEMAIQAQLKEVEILYNAAIPDNKDYTLERVRKFSHQQAFISALGAAIEQVHINDTEGAYSILTAANRVGTTTEEELESACDLVDAEIDGSQNILGNRLLERCSPLNPL